jgi:hypothetical protein
MDVASSGCGAAGGGIACGMLLVEDCSNQLLPGPERGPVDSVAVVGDMDAEAGVGDYRKIVVDAWQIAVLGHHGAPADRPAFEGESDAGHRRVDAELGVFELRGESFAQRCVLVEERRHETPHV